MIHYCRYLLVKMKVFNYSELHFSEVTSYKIPTLVLDVTFLNRYTNTNQIVLTRLKKQVQLIIDCGHKKELLCCLEKVPY